MMSEAESPWCRLCGEHRKSHGKNLGKLIKRIDHKFVAEWQHKDIVYSEVEERPGPVLGNPESGPQPEFPLEELVTKNVKEPKIEFNYGNCTICEIPLTEEYEHVNFCGDCAENTFMLLYGGNKGEGNLPN